MVFRDKVVVITGAGSGIGRATAQAFAAEGSRVHLVDIDGEKAQHVARQLQTKGAVAEAHQVDCSQAEQVEALAAQLFATEGRVHILHNNAGIIHGAPVEEIPLSDWRRVLDINLYGTIYGIHSFVPRMLEAGVEGHIVNTASGLGLISSPGMAPYCASKYAVVGLSESLAAELAPRGIGVSVVCPGVTSTELVRNAITSDSVQDSRNTMERVMDAWGATPEEVAEAVLQAIRKKRVIQVVPKRQMLPVWWLKRLSVPTYHKLSSLMNRLVHPEK